MPITVLQTLTQPFTQELIHTTLYIRLEHVGIGVGIKRLELRRLLIGKDLGDLRIEIKAYLHVKCTDEMRLLAQRLAERHRSKKHTTNDNEQNQPRHAFCDQCRGAFNTF